MTALPPTAFPSLGSSSSLKPAAAVRPNHQQERQRQLDNGQKQRLPIDEGPQLQQMSTNHSQDKRACNVGGTGLQNLSAATVVTEVPAPSAHSAILAKSQQAVPAINSACAVADQEAASPALSGKASAEQWAQCATAKTVQAQQIDVGACCEPEQAVTVHLSVQREELKLLIRAASTAMASIDPVHDNVVQQSALPVQTATMQAAVLSAVAKQQQNCIDNAGESQLGRSGLSNLRSDPATSERAAAKELGTEQPGHENPAAPAAQADQVEDGLEGPATSSAGFFHLQPCGHVLGVSHNVDASHNVDLHMEELSELHAHQQHSAAHHLGAVAHQQNMPAHQLSAIVHQQSIPANQLSAIVHQQSVPAHQLSTAAHQQILVDPQLSIPILLNQVANGACRERQGQVQQERGARQAVSAFGTQGQSQHAMLNMSSAACCTLAIACHCLPVPYWI